MKAWGRYSCTCIADLSRGCQVRGFAKKSRPNFWICDRRRTLFDLYKSNYSKHNTAKMPKSKRAKIVHLTKTDKKGKELSQKLFANVQEAADTFQHIFVFAVENMRNSYLKEVRAEFADSRCAYRCKPSPKCIL